MVNGATVCARHTTAHSDKVGPVTDSTPGGSSHPHLSDQRDIAFVVRRDRLAVLRMGVRVLEDLTNAKACRVHWRLPKALKQRHLLHPTTPRTYRQVQDESVAQRRVRTAIQWAGRLSRVGMRRTGTTGG